MSTDAGSAGSPVSLEELVGEWLTFPDVAQRLGIPVTRVRALVQDRHLVALQVGERPVWRVPARFLGPEGLRHDLRGTVIVLADGGMNDEELVTWLFTPDPTLPVPGSPMDALDAGHKTEIRRRAMETAF